MTNDHNCGPNKIYIFINIFYFFITTVLFILGAYLFV